MRMNERGTSVTSSNDSYMQRFWVLLGTGTMLLAFGLVAFGVALANQDDRHLDTECPPQSRSCVPPDIARSMARRFDRGINPAPWWIAGGISTCVGLLFIGSAVTMKRRASATTDAFGPDVTA